MSDIVVKQKIERSPATVARIMFDPANDTKWIDGAKKVDPFESAPTEIGAKIKRHGAFWGRNFTWVTETTGFEPERRLSFRYVEGPMTGDVTYGIAVEDTGASVTVRHTGATSLMPGGEMFLKRSLQADLGRLKRLVEKQPR